jgi:predicted metal-dependent hydrolase
MEGVTEQLKITLDLLKDNLRRNEQTIALLIEENRSLKEELAKIKNKVSTKQTFNDKFIKKLNRQKKEIIKTKMLEFLESKDYILADLKDLIVDDLSYCSKATFYRYIEDLNRKGLISLIRQENNTIIAKNGRIEAQSKVM